MAVTSYQSSGSRYISLRFISFIFTLLALLCLIPTAIFVMNGVKALDKPAPRAEVVPVNLNNPRAAQAFLDNFQFSSMSPSTVNFIFAGASLLSAVTWFAMASVIRMLIHMEENSRATAQLLEQLVDLAGRSGPRRA